MTVTLVVRLWLDGSPQRSQGFRYEATHVQTGEVAYFRTLENLVQHIERLREQLLASPAPLRAPIEFPSPHQRP
jgi:hypothetical protein